MNKSITIKIKGIDKDKIIGQEIGDDNRSYDKNKIIDIDMNKNIYLALLVEMKKANIDVDEELECFINRIFTFFEREWRGDQIFGAALRKDIEMI